MLYLTCTGKMVFMIQVLCKRNVYMVITYTPFLVVASTYSIERMELK